MTPFHSIKDVFYLKKNLKYIVFSLLPILTLQISAQRIPHKALICGVCKDIAPRVPYSMRIMEKIGALFEDYRIIAYENNSSDETPRLIREWQEANKKVLGITESVSKTELEKTIINRYKDGSFFRPELIARARNIILEQALSNKYDGFDIVIWMDMDFIIEPNYAAIQETFESSREWDAVFAYGVDPYYRYWDWYALRDRRYPIGPELLGRFWWTLYKQLILDPKGEWYPVYSAFGGCGIYKKESIKNCRYSALVTQDLSFLMAQLIEENKNHWLVQRYLYDIRDIKEPCIFLYPSTKGYPITDPNIGIKTSFTEPRITWKMNSEVCNFPAVCEHVTFHASMIKQGHYKLFINPRLVFYYGESVA